MSALEFKTRITGSTYVQGGSLQLAKLREGTSLALIREPDNPHDPNAIAVYRDGTMLGHVPRDVAKKAARLMDDGHDYSCACYIRGRGAIRITFSQYGRGGF